jgi:Fur family ferric uptake transcriptional regulator
VTEVAQRRGADQQATCAAAADALARLKEAGVKASRERAAVVEAFFAEARRVTAEEIANVLRQRGLNVSLTTVYRTLAVLVEHRLARAHRSGKGQGRFEPADPGRRRGHLVCTRCRVAVDLADEIGNALELQIARRHGFHVRAHEIKVRGVCAKCAREAADAS